MRRAAPSVLMMWAAVASAETIEQERADVAQRLAAERLALATAKTERASAKEVIDLLGKMAHDSQARASAAEARLARLSRRIQRAHATGAEAQVVYQDMAARLGPRLRAMYRLTRRNPLDVLLTAEGFAEAVRRSRALHAVLESDVQWVGETRNVLMLQRQEQEELESLQASAGEEVLALEDEEQSSQRQQQELRELLDTLQADASTRTERVSELEQRERRLAVEMALLAKTADSPFARLKGRLPFPTQGLVEVGFGRILNPRFNTVTVQKGLDIRAPTGTPVRAVADGTLVYAQWLRGYGNIAIVDHGGGFHTLMAHLSGFARAVGDVLHQGDVVGQVGETASLKGSYLYFELRRRGDAVDPAPWLSGESH